MRTDWLPLADIIPMPLRVRIQSAYARRGKANLRRPTSRKAILPQDTTASENASPSSESQPRRPELSSRPADTVQVAQIQMPRPSRLAAEPWGRRDDRAIQEQSHVAFIVKAGVHPINT